MPLSDPTVTRDHSIAYLEFFDAQRREAIKCLIGPSVIEEHRTNPTQNSGHHSPELQEVLNYLRMTPVDGKIFVIAEVPYESYRLGQITGRGQPTAFLDEGPFSTEGEAMHAVFLKRLEIVDVDNALLEGKA